VQVAHDRGRRRGAGVRRALTCLLVSAALLGGAPATTRIAHASDEPKPFEGFAGVPGEWTDVLSGYVRDPRTYGPHLIAIERESGGNLPPIFRMATADAYLRAGNRRAAERIFEDSLAQNLGYPWSDFANIGMGTIRLTSGDQDAALDYFGRVAESEESSSQALGNLGMGAALSASGRFAEAQEAFAETASIDTVEQPVRDAGRFGSAMALFGAGDYAAAARAFDDIAQSTPGGTLAEDARYAAARARIALGDREGSAAALRELAATCDPRAAGRRAPRAMRNLDARAMGRNWLRNYRRTGWSSMSDKGGTMYSIGGCALAKSTLRALERGDASLTAIRPVAAAVAAAPVAAAAPPQAAAPPAGPPAAAARPGASWAPVGWLVAGIAVLLLLWRALARRARGGQGAFRR
jgi:tetratricopeptide (TPR) repeat protein